MLPFADLVLLSQSASIGIIFSTFLSIKYLGEKFIIKYDLVAIALICTGSSLTILQSNKEEVLITQEMAVQFLFCKDMLIYVSSVFVVIASCLVYFYYYLKKINSASEAIQRYRYNQNGGFEETPARLTIGFLENCTSD